MMRTRTSPTATLFILVTGAFVLLRRPRARPVATLADTGSADHDRGRDADVPEAIPVKGLRDVFWRVVREVSGDRVTLIAAGVTFYLLLALFPALAALVSLYGLIADPITLSDHLRELSALLPPGAFDLIANQLRALVEKQNTTLGITFFMGVAVALWSAHSGTLAIFDAMNVAYEEKEKRGLVKLNAIALCFTLGAMLSAVLMVGVLAIMPLVLSFLWLDHFKENLALLLRWLLSTASDRAGNQPDLGG